MDTIYAWQVGIHEDLRFPPELRTERLAEISFQGTYGSPLARSTKLDVGFRNSPEDYHVSVTAGPSGYPPLDELPVAEWAHPEKVSAMEVAEKAGFIRFFRLPTYLESFNKDIRDVFVLPGKRPFGRYRLGPSGEEVPTAYQPYGPWKLEPNDDPFDLTSTASLVLPKKFTHKKPLADLVEELFHTGSGFVQAPTAVVARLDPGNPSK